MTVTADDLPAWARLLPWPEIVSASEKHKLDPLLVAAVCQIESSGNCLAMRYEPGYRWTFDVNKWALFVGSSALTEEFGQKTSWGVCQVMGSVAREHGFKDWFPALCNLQIGLDYGCRHLKKMQDKYGANALDVYAAYNAGSVRKTSTGSYDNQVAVDKFHRFYGELVSVQRTINH